MGLELPDIPVLNVDCKPAIAVAMVLLCCQGLNILTSRSSCVGIILLQIGAVNIRLYIIGAAKTTDQQIADFFTKQFGPGQVFSSHSAGIIGFSLCVINCVLS